MGRLGEDPGPIALLGPSKTCFCCDLCNSSIWARSVSKMTGANRMTELVKNIQLALHENVYRLLQPLTVPLVMAPTAWRNGSGNISVRPQKRSPTDSSGSWIIKQKGEHILISFHR